MNTSTFESSSPVSPHSPLSPINAKRFQSLSERLAIVSLVLSSAALALAGAGWMKSTSIQVATVDVPRIIAEASQTLAKSYPTGNVPKSVMERIVQHIKETTEAYGRENQLMILAKGAVFSGEKQDLTEQILKVLEQEGVRDDEQ